MKRAAPSLCTFCVTALVGTASPAFPENTCAPRSDVVGRLIGSYSERQVFLGMAQNGGVVELYVAPNGAAWTIVISLPNGMTCLVAAGNGYEIVQAIGEPV